MYYEWVMEGPPQGEAPRSRFAGASGQRSDLLETLQGIVKEMGCDNPQQPGSYISLEPHHDIPGAVVARAENRGWLLNLLKKIDIESGVLRAITESRPEGQPPVVSGFGNFDMAPE